MLKAKTLKKVRADVMKARQIVKDLSGADNSRTIGGTNEDKKYGGGDGKYGGGAEKEHDEYPAVRKNGDKGDGTQGGAPKM